jgi:predicted Fe-S protein YdhL (DUF1289 family)
MNDSRAPVTSPCTNNCHLDQATGRCTGCLRTVDEIMQWPSATAAEKRQILARLRLRKRLQ